MTDRRVSRAALRVLETGPTADRRLSRAALRVLETGPTPDRRVSRAALRVLIRSNTHALEAAAVTVTAWPLTLSAGAIVPLDVAAVTVDAHSLTVGAGATVALDVAAVTVAAHELDVTAGALDPFQLAAAALTVKAWDIEAELPLRRYGLEIRSDNPVAWWTLQEALESTVMRDVTDNDLDGTYVNDVILRQPFLSLGGACVEFDPAVPANYGVAPGDPLMAAAEWSVECRFLADNVNATLRTIFARDGSSIRGWIVYLYDGHIRVTFAESAESFDSDRSITVGTVYHVVVTYDGFTARLYINGQLDTAVELDNPNLDETLDFYIGAGPAGTGTVARPFDGLIDGVSLYDYELSPSRVLAHYESGTVFFESDGPVRITCVGIVEYDPDVIEPPDRLTRIPDYVIHTGRADE